MAILSKGTTFSTGDQVTSTGLNALVDSSTFASGAVDSTSTVLAGGAITVKDNGITTAKLNDLSVSTAKLIDASVTKAKIEDLADYTVLGNVSGGAATPAEVTILDEDTLLTDSATALATQQSIKAYVDTSKTSAFTPSTYAGEESVTLPNGLIMKFGTISALADDVTDVNFGVAFNATIAAQLTIEQNDAVDRKPIKIGSLDTSTLAIRSTSGADLLVHWLVFGR